jgi:hypothetical protein
MATATELSGTDLAMRMETVRKNLFPAAVS